MCLVQIEKFYPRCGHSKRCQQEEMQPDCACEKLAFKMVTDHGPCNRCAVKAAKDASTSNPNNMDGSDEAKEPKVLKNKQAKRIWKIRYRNFEKLLNPGETTIPRALKRKTFRIDKSQVTSPVLRIIPRNHIEEHDDKCGICLGSLSDPYDSEDACVAGGARQLPCGHIFGGTCLTTWLDNGSRCPNCRTAFDVVRAHGREPREIRREIPEAFNFNFNFNFNFDRVEDAPMDERSFVSRLQNNLIIIMSVLLFITQRVFVDWDMPVWWYVRYGQASRWAKTIFALGLLAFVLVIIPLTGLYAHWWAIDNVMNIVYPLIPSMEEIRALGRTIRKGLVVPGMILGTLMLVSVLIDTIVLGVLTLVSFVLELILADAVLVENIH